MATLEVTQENVVFPNIDIATNSRGTQLSIQDAANIPTGGGTGGRPYSDSLPDPSVDYLSAVTFYTTKSSGMLVGYQAEYTPGEGIGAQPAEQPMRGNLGYFGEAIAEPVKFPDRASIMTATAYVDTVEGFTLVVGLLMMCLWPEGFPIRLIRVGNCTSTDRFSVIVPIGHEITGFAGNAAAAIDSMGFVVEAVPSWRTY